MKNTKGTVGVIILEENVTLDESELAQNSAADANVPVTNHIFFAVLYVSAWGKCRVGHVSPKNGPSICGR